MACICFNALVAASYAQRFLRVHVQGQRQGATASFLCRLMYTVAKEGTLCLSSAQLQRGVLYFVLGLAVDCGGLNGWCWKQSWGTSLTGSVICCDACCDGSVCTRRKVSTA